MGSGVGDVDLLRSGVGDVDLLGSGVGDVGLLGSGVGDVGMPGVGDQQFVCRRCRRLDLVWSDVGGL